MSETRTETRVRFVFKTPIFLHEPKNLICIYDGSPLGSTPDDAAVDSWLMENCIAWVETRTVLETEWEPLGEEPTLSLEFVPASVHNPLSPTCERRLGGEPFNNAVLCYICDFRNIREYENYIKAVKPE